jgi:hypothetical protein
MQNILLIVVIVDLTVDLPLILDEVALIVEEVEVDDEEVVGKNIRFI